MDGPTEKQRRIFDFVEEKLRKGFPAPTMREIAEAFGYRSKRAAECHILPLIEKGWLAQDAGKARSLRLGNAVRKIRGPLADIPVFGQIPAGIADDREQEADSFVTVSVDVIGFKPTRNTFALRVKGDSMIGKHICDGDIVVLEHGPDPRNGQIVAALIDRKTTLKTFLLRNGKPFLRAENPKYPDLIPCEELVIQGVFKALIRKASG